MANLGGKSKVKSTKVNSKRISVDRRNVLKANVKSPTEWGFDLTGFEKGGFQKVLEGLGIPVTEGELQKRTLIDGTEYNRNFSWKGNGIEIITGNNPITGKYTSPKQRGDEKDYASYIGIEGKPEKVSQAVELIKKYRIRSKGESKGRRDFI